MRRERGRKNRGRERVKEGGAGERALEEEGGGGKRGRGGGEGVEEEVASQRKILFPWKCTVAGAH